MLFRFRYFRTLAALAALTSLGACSKDDPKPNPTDAVGVSWTVDGANVKATLTEKDVMSTDIKIEGAVGSASSGSVVSLTMPKTVGTYTLTSASDATAVYATGNSTSGTAYFAESGTITVTVLTATNVRGTFNFKGVDALGGTTATKTITNGAFNIAL